MPAPFLSQFFRRYCLTVAVVEISLWIFINAEHFILTMRRISVILPILFVSLPFPLQLQLFNVEENQRPILTLADFSVRIACAAKGLRNWCLLVFFLFVCLVGIVLFTLVSTFNMWRDLQLIYNMQFDRIMIFMWMQMIPLTCGCITHCRRSQ